jgi:hypothetical protein
LLKKAVGLAAILIMCTACSKLEKKYGAFTPDRNGAYLKQTATPPLVLPADYKLDARMASDHFPLPSGQLPPPGAEPVSIVPPTLSTELGVKKNAKS